MRFVLLGICVILLHVESAELQTRRDVCSVHAASDVGDSHQNVFERSAKVKDEREEEVESDIEFVGHSVLGSSFHGTEVISGQFGNAERVAVLECGWASSHERLSLLGRLLV
ncbi:MAG: hypothetical protein H6824_22310 [Planctomycetaceae bacterium]|nr:hypothetical protein [Planctomycetaceae bacterium]